MPRPVSDKGRLNQGRRPTTRKPMPTGRHSKLTPEISKKITDAVRAGNHLSVAARYAGVGESTLQQWLMRGRGELSGRNSTKLYKDFANDISEAQAASEVAAVLHWRSAMPKDWHAAKDYLKVTHPDRWDPDRDKAALLGPMAGLQINIGTNGSGQAGTTLNHTEMPLEDLIETDPAFLKAIMPLFDAVDAAYAVEDAQTSEMASQTPNFDQSRALAAQNVQSDPETAINGSKGPNEAVDAVFDAEEGTWRVVSTESPDLDA